MCGAVLINYYSIFCSLKLKPCAKLWKDQENLFILKSYNLSKAPFVTNMALLILLPHKNCKVGRISQSCIMKSYNLFVKSYMTRSQKNFCEFQMINLIKVKLVQFWFHQSNLIFFSHRSFLNPWIWWSRKRQRSISFFELFWFTGFFHLSILIWSSSRILSGISLS